MHRISVTFSDEEWQKIQAFRASQEVRPSAAAIVRHMVALAPVGATGATTKHRKVAPDEGVPAANPVAPSRKKPPKPAPKLDDDDELDDAGIPDDWHNADE